MKWNIYFNMKWYFRMKGVLEFIPVLSKILFSILCKFIKIIANILANISFRKKIDLRVNYCIRFSPLNIPISLTTLDVKCNDGGKSEFPMGIQQNRE